MLEKFRQFIKSHRSLIIILGIFFLLRIPSLFEPHWYEDEGIYATIAFAISKGQMLYRDIYDHKPPGIFYIYLLSGNTMLSIKIANLIAGLVSVLGIYKITCKNLDKSKAILASFIFTLLMATPLFEGNVSNAENFFMPFIIWGFYFSCGERRLDKVLTGLIFGLAFLIKFHPLFDLGAIVIVGIILSWDGVKSIWGNLQKIIFSNLPIFLAFIAPVGLYSLFEFARGNFINFLYAGYLDSFDYVQNGSNVNVFTTLQFKLLLLLTYNIVIYLLYRRKIVEQISYKFAFLLGFEMFAAVLSGRSYPHYLIQITFAISIVLAIYIYHIYLYSNWKQLLSRIAVSFIAIIFFIAYFFQNSQSLRSLSIDRQLELLLRPVNYYSNFIKHSVSGTLGSDEAKTIYGYEQFDLVHVREKVDKYNPKTLYIYSDNGWMYYAVDRTPPYRIFLAFHLWFKSDNSRQQELLRELDEKDTEMLVVDEDKGKFEGFAEFIEKNYDFLESADGFSYYKLKENELN